MGSTTTEMPCRLGNRSIDAAAFSHLAQLHLGHCDANTPVLVYEPASETGGVGYGLNRLLLAYHYAALHRVPLLVSHREPWLWTRAVRLERRNATMADVYWPSACEATVAAGQSLASFTRARKMTWFMRQCQNYRICDWANRVPRPFAGQCVVWWFSRLAHFHLRPSQELAAALRQFALSDDRCPRRLCGAHVAAAEPQGSLLARRLRDDDAQRWQERAVLRHSQQRTARSSQRPVYRPSWVGQLARRLLLLPNQSLNTPVHSLYARGGDSCAAFIRPRCRGMEEGWELLRRALRQRGAGEDSRRSLVLVSTDTGSRSSWGVAPKQWPFAQRPRTLAFAFSRTSYQANELIEFRLKRGSGLKPTHLLLEALLDLTLAAQANRVHVGSFYSNFARLALLLSGSFEYASFDGLWCPYELCNVGRRDARRFCSGRSPLDTVDIELRGSPLDKRAPVHSARIAWVKAMESLSQRRGFRSVQRPSLPANTSFEACVASFRELQQASLPLIY